MHSAVAYHDRIASDWDPRYRKASFAVREAILAACLTDLPLASTRWLDAGCGSGTLARWLARRGCRVDGVDASAHMIRAADELARHESYGNRLSFRVGALEQLDGEAGGYDGVLCSSVLEYLDRPADCLARFARLLKPRGALVVSVPHKYSLVRRALAVVHRLAPNRLAYFRHSKNEYSLREFSLLLQENHFEVERAYYFGGGLPGRLQRLPCFASLIMFLAFRTIELSR